MDVELLRNGDIFNLHLGSGACPMSQHPQPPKRHQQHPLTPSAQSSKRKNPEKRSNCCQIISYCLGLCSCNAWLREVDRLGTRPQDRSNRLRPRRKNTTENK